MNEAVIALATLLALAMFIWAVMNAKRDKPEQETLAPECETDRRVMTIEFGGKHF